MGRRSTRVSWIVGLATLVALVVLVAGHFADARRFATLVEHARPELLGVAVALQIATYGCAGAIWRVVAASAGYRLRARELARLAVERLTVDQLFPAGGMTGHLVVARALTRLGVPAALATEALLIDILSFYAAFALATLASMIVLLVHHDVTGVVLGLVGTFSVVLASVPLAIAWALRHRSWRPPPWLERRAVVARVADAIRHASPERVWRPLLLAETGLLQLAIFVLDAATLFATMWAAGAPVHPLTAFVGLVMGTIAGTVSPFPGGIGGFEAGCTATLALLGVPVEAALTGTLLLRGLTLWLPLGPGLFLARHELRAGRAA